MTEWEYLRERGEPDLNALGNEGWELVALRGDEWVFKRPAPEPFERFTLEQRDAALADVEHHRGITRHLLNPEIAALIRRVNHTQMLLIADRGFPVFTGMPIVDISLTADVPTVPQVLSVILPDLPADRLLVAAEQRLAAPECWAMHQEGTLRVEAVPHLQFKHFASLAVGCVRTGDATPYSNVIVVGG